MRSGADLAFGLLFDEFVRKEKGNSDPQSSAVPSQEAKFRDSSRPDAEISHPPSTIERHVILTKPKCGSP
jgi:hypothetical protein